MWSRAELKDRAKRCLRKYFWSALLVSVMVALLGGEGGGTFQMEQKSRSQSGYSYEVQMNGGRLPIKMILPAEAGDVFRQTEMSPLFSAIMALVAGVALLLVVGMIIFGIFVGLPMTVGGKRFYMESRSLQCSAGVGRTFYAFGCGSYGNVVKTMFLKELYIFLWSLLLVVPGIIKHYQYYMVPYILSENPDMNHKDVLRLSTEMMDGSKLDVLVLELSFIGWYILVVGIYAVTTLFAGWFLPFYVASLSGAMIMIAGTFALQPYISAAFAELYAVLRTGIPASVLRGFGGEPYGYDDNIISNQ